MQFEIAANVLAVVFRALRGGPSAPPCGPSALPLPGEPTRPAAPRCEIIAAKKSRLGSTNMIAVGLRFSQESTASLGLRTRRVKHSLLRPLGSVGFGNPGTRHAAGARGRSVWGVLSGPSWIIMSWELD